jgi:hypothetical protein
MHQPGKHLHRFEPGVVIGLDVDNDTIHHKEFACLRLFDNVPSLIKERDQTLAVKASRRK